MPQKVVLIADPGIDTAFAVALAMHDPNLDVIGLLPSAGNVSAHQATLNVNVLIDQLDPPRWPRTAAALRLPLGAIRERHGARGADGGREIAHGRLEHRVRGRVVEGHRDDLGQPARKLVRGVGEVDAVVESHEYEDEELYIDEDEYRRLTGLETD